MDVPISLYLKTEQGEHPDLKVVAKVALTFAEIIEDAARAIDPEMEIRVEIVSGSEGSLGLNTMNRIKVAASNAKQAVITGWRKHEKARFLAVYVAVKVLDNGLSWSQERVMNWMAGDDAPQEVRALSPEERRALAAEIVDQLRQDQARTQSQDNVYKLHRQVEKDKRISAIGVTAVPKAAVSLLRRDEFAEGFIEPEETDRITTQRFEATLVSPVLEMGTRRWKLRGPSGEFGAPIADQVFLQKAVSGETSLHLRGGVILDVEVAIYERLVDGVWVIQQRAVDRVYGWREGPVQGDLLTPA